VLECIAGRGIRAERGVQRCEHDPESGLFTRPVQPAQEVDRVLEIADGVPVPAPLDVRDRDVHQDACTPVGVAAGFLECLLVQRVGTADLPLFEKERGTLKKKGHFLPRSGGRLQCFLVPFERALRAAIELLQFRDPSGRVGSNGLDVEAQARQVTPSGLVETKLEPPQVAVMQMQRRLLRTSVRDCRRQHPVQLGFGFGPLPCRNQELYPGITHMQFDTDRGRWHGTQQRLEKRQAVEEHRFARRFPQ
jgi:hypothetical protein